jgi:hypothetical protein
MKHKKHFGLIIAAIASALILVGPGATPSAANEGIRASNPMIVDVVMPVSGRNRVRDLLADIAKHGLTGKHHYFITFKTTAPGVQLSPRLLEKYPDAMTIVLQYQFANLKVRAQAFSITLGFTENERSRDERLVIPFDAVTALQDPSDGLSLNFE